MQWRPYLDSTLNIGEDISKVCNDTVSTRDCYLYYRFGKCVYLEMQVINQ